MGEYVYNSGNEKNFLGMISNAATVRKGLKNLTTLKQLQYVKQNKKMRGQINWGKCLCKKRIVNV